MISKRTLYIFVTACFFLLVFVGIWASIVSQGLATPPGTKYSWGAGYMPDYYQYLAWIKDGSMGDILITSRYTPESGPKALIHPIFPLTGLLLRPLSLATPIAYAILRTTALLVFLLTLVALIRRLFEGYQGKIIATLLILTGTGYYTVSFVGGKPTIIDPVSWSGNFNVIGKFGIPPHHLLALAALIGVALVLFNAQQTIRMRVVQTLLGIAIGLLNPATLLFTDLFLVVTATFVSIFNKAWRKRLFLSLSLFLFTTTPILLYDMYIFKTLPPWSVMYTLMKAFNPPVRFSEYLAALGPLVGVSLLTFMNRKIWLHRPLVIFLMVWAFLPIGLYPLLGKLLPMNNARLFQSYQFVPFALLGAVGIVSVRRRLSQIGSHIIIGIAGLLWAYGIVAYLVTLLLLIPAHDQNAYNIFIPNGAIHAFEYLEKESLRDSVVLSGELVSQMIPAYSHNRTVIARDDTAINYYEKQHLAFAFLDGKMTGEEALSFLTRYHISFLLLGIDAQAFETLPYRTSPFLKEVFRDGQISVVQVVR